MHLRDDVIRPRGEVAPGRGSPAARRAESGSAGVEERHELVLVVAVEQDLSEHLLGAQEVVQVGAGVVVARVARAAGQLAMAQRERERGEGEGERDGRGIAGARDG